MKIRKMLPLSEKDIGNVLCIKPGDIVNFLLMQQRNKQILSNTNGLLITKMDIFQNEDISVINTIFDGTPMTFEVKYDAKYATLLTGGCRFNVALFDYEFDQLFRFRRPIFDVTKFNPALPNWVYDDTVDEEPSNGGITFDEFLEYHGYDLD